ncbi:MAG: hypothetical protein J3K34DRAFT_272993 [Monoraphidium minutum]|nr:MAG: hypothetical protein J3K34DRAFT_272993 [Monoraphidium minutum]
MSAGGAPAAAAAPWADASPGRCCRGSTSARSARTSNADTATRRSTPSCRRRPPSRRLPAPSGHVSRRTVHAHDAAAPAAGGGSSRRTGPAGVEWIGSTSASSMPRPSGSACGGASPNGAAKWLGSRAPGQSGSRASCRPRAPGAASTPYGTMRTDRARRGVPPASPLLLCCARAGGALRRAYVQAPAVAWPRMASVVSARSLDLGYW